MTLAELKERIKEEVVLHEGDLKEWQWRRNGLLTEAEQDGIASAEFMRLVNDVSYQLGGLFPRINTLKTTAEAYARADKKQLLPFHIDEIVAEAERLTLSRAFVTQRWIPAILATIPDPPKSEMPAAPVAVSVAPPVVENPLSRDEVRQKIASRLDSYKSQRIIPSWLLKDLLVAIKADELVVTEEIFSYLVNNLFKAVREPEGNTLRERLVSSDWQNVLYKSTLEQAPITPPEPYYPEPSLSPETPPFVRTFTAQPARIHKGETVTLSWEVDNLLAVTIDDLGAGLSPVNRGWVKPNKTTDYTLFDANNNPLSTVRVEVVPRDRSGVYGVLFALALLAIIYWFIKSSNARDRAPDSKPKTEQTTYSSDKRSSPKKEPIASKQPEPDIATSEATDTPDRRANEQELAMTEPTKKQETLGNRPVETTLPAEPETKSTTPVDARKGKYEEAFGDKSYDKVELGTDEQGWRRARKNGRWGYINEDDEWMIPPAYEAVTPFRGNTASVFLNGRLLTIDRAGQLVSK